MKQSLVYGLLALVLLPAAWGAPVSGRVALDQNGNGTLDAGEPGVPGVLVSDGTTVQRTDAQGTYTLDVPELPAILRISQPRDHRAVGAFWRRTEGGRAENFLLRSEAQPESFFFVQMTDSHLGRVDLCKKFVAERLNQFPVPLQFVINTGDLVGGVDTVPIDKAMKQYDGYREAMQGLNRPLFNLPGNHEHVAFQRKDADKTDARYGKGLYRQVFGPMHYSWDWGPYHFVALDGTRLPYQERLGERQLAWLKQDLERTPADTPILLFCHQPLPHLRDKAELQKVLEGHKVLAGLCGHSHETDVLKLGEIPVYRTGAFCGSWWSGPNPDGTPQGFAVIRLADGKLDYAYTAREGMDSLYVSSPNSARERSGQMPFEVTVLELTKGLQIEAKVGDQAIPVQRKETQAFSSVWQGTVDTTRVPDGLMDLKVSAVRGDGTRSAAAMRYLVINGNEAPYEAKGDATLKMRVRGIDADDGVYLGDQLIGTIPKGTPNEQEISITIPAAQLKRLTAVTIRAGGPENKDDFSVGPIWLVYQGKTVRDVRYVSFARHSIGDNAPDRYPTERTLYFCLP